jgi:nitrous oxide reductase
MTRLQITRRLLGSATVTIAAVVVALGSAPAASASPATTHTRPAADVIPQHRMPPIFVPECWLCMG